MHLLHIMFRDKWTGFKKTAVRCKNRFSLQAVYRKIVFFLDVDDLKKVNDQYGHHVGDLLLIHLAEVLKMLSCRKLYGQMGRGGIFNCCLRMHIKKGRGLWTWILDCCAATPFHYGDVSLNLSLSMGITAFKQFDISNYSSILQYVDQCLYLAKALGKNQYQFKEYPYSQ